MNHFRDEYLKQKEELGASGVGEKRKIDPEKLDVLVADIE
jgi:hypothetical protein